MSRIGLLLQPEREKAIKCYNMATASHSQNLNIYAYSNPLYMYKIFYYLHTQIILLINSFFQSTILELLYVEILQYSYVFSSLYGQVNIYIC